MRTQNQNWLVSLSLIALSVAALSADASALPRNEGPFGNPGSTPPNRPKLAEVSSFGPGALPVYIPSKVVTIYDGGTVVYATQDRENRWYYQTLATLAEPSLAGLNKAVTKLPPSELETPKTPCPTGDSTRHDAFAADGSPVPLQREACSQRQRRVDYKGGAIITLLNAFLRIAEQDHAAEGVLYPIEGEVLARATLSVGFAPPHLARSKELRITAEGQVVVFTKYRDGRTEKLDLLTFEPAILRALRHKAQELTLDALVTTESPKCYDAPSQQQFVYRPAADGGVIVPIWNSFQCVESAQPWSNSGEFFHGLLTELSHGSTIGR